MRFYQTAQATDFRHFDTNALFDLLAQMKKIADKKGVVVIMQDDYCLTTYNLNSYRRK